MSDYW